MSTQKSQSPPHRPRLKPGARQRNDSELDGANTPPDPPERHALDLSGLPTDLPDLETVIDTDFSPTIEPKRREFSAVYRERARKVNTIDAIKVERAASCIAALPEPGEYLHMVVGHEFAGFNLLPAMLRLAGASGFGRLYLTTLGFSRDNLSQLAVMVDEGKVQPAKTKILCGDFFRRADDSLWDVGKLLAAERGFGFRSCRNHTKLILAEVAHRFYVVESSANLRSCANIELFTMTQSRPLFDFHAQWIEAIWPDAQA